MKKFFLSCFPKQGMSLNGVTALSAKGPMLQDKFGTLWAEVHGPASPQHRFNGGLRQQTQVPEGPRKEPGRREISDVRLIEFCEFLLSNAGEYFYPAVNPGLTGTDLWIPRIPSGLSASNWQASSCGGSLLIGRMWSNCGC